MKFYKCHGTGNDFIIIDDRRKKFPAKNVKLISNFCNRRTGIGADGLILLRNHPRSDFEMVYYNSDGRIGSMCGNGGRCAAALSYKLGLAGKKNMMTAYDGKHSAEILSQDREKENFLVKLSMNSVDDYKIYKDCIYVNTGSPHCVCEVKNVGGLDIISEGRKLRYDKRFSPGGANINFLYNKTSRLSVRTYERGVEDETLSCGTGVIASALAVALSKKNSSGNKTTVIKTPGGNLKVYYSFDNKKFSNIYLKGPAVIVYSGELNI
ncbi:MAG: diaminopimelate epimerase [Bacteroidia bacterium]|nr:diaminopimelate epimerase [Bacteroidia bacterium]